MDSSSSILPMQWILKYKLLRVNNCQHTDCTTQEQKLAGEAESMTLEIELGLLYNTQACWLRPA